MLLKLVSGGSILAIGTYTLKDDKKAECWIYRDDIGAWWGIKGYEE